MKAPIQKFDPKSYQQTRKAPYFEKLVLFFCIFDLIFGLTLHKFWLRIFILSALLAAKYKIEGNNYRTVFVYLGSITFVLGQMIGVWAVEIIGVSIVGVGCLLKYCPYEMPEVKGLVGFREKIDDRGAYVCEFYPLVQTQPIPTAKQINWVRHRQIKRITQASNSPTMDKMAAFFMSDLTHRKLTVGEGKQDTSCSTLMIFCHGRGATPLYLSYFLRRFASKRKVVAMQHNQKPRLWLPREEALKIIYQEIDGRAQELVQLVKRWQGGYKEIVLIGHSYGSGTIVRACGILKDQQVWGKIKNLILLDPWFQGLTDQVIKLELGVRILMLENQYFIEYENMYTVNRKYLQIHKSSVTHLCWKDSSHLHQTDVPFLLGDSLFLKVPRAEKGVEMLEKNILAVQMFLEGADLTQIVEKFDGEKDVVQVGYKPLKWRVDDLKY